MFNYRQKLIAKHIQLHNQVLDIGFAEIPNKYLKNQEVIGIDIKEIPKPENYSKIIVGNAVDLTLFFKESSIESICTGELLEHLFNPLDFLKKCHSILKPNGIFVMTTPNPHHFFEFASTIFMSTKIFYASEHVCIYPQRWLIRMMELSGFTEVKIKSGGISIPFVGNVWFPRPIAEFSFVIGKAKK